MEEVNDLFDDRDIFIIYVGWVLGFVSGPRVTGCAVLCVT